MAGRSEQELKDELIKSLVLANPDAGVDVCFSFDTTGSMYTYLERVRQNVTETLQELFKIPNIRIAVMTHGDYCDGKDIITSMDFRDKERMSDLVKFVTNAPMTCGGDYPEAYEYMLKKARELKWGARTVKALVMIGDAPPQPPSYTTEDIYWRDEIHHLFVRYRKLGVKIYAVQANPNAHCMPFYQECARRTGGVYLELRNFHLITAMFKAVCYRERSKQALQKYLKTLDEDVRKDKLFSKLEHETPPPPLGHYSNDWWDRNNDHGTPGYRFEKGVFVYGTINTGRVVAKKGAAPTLAKKKKVKPLSTEELLTAAISAARDSSKTVSGTHTTRTGTRILDTANPEPKAPKVEETWPKHELKEVKPGVFEIVELVYDPQTAPGPKSKSAKDANTTLTKEQFQENAVKRLMRDYLEVKRCPIHNISAVPLSDNMLEWHCNLGGPARSVYSNCIFHLVLTFPHNYPRKPPSVTLCTKLYHDNVFGQWVCLDMLELGGWSETKEMDTIFTGWSYGYSVLSILLQLQAFLFEGVYDEYHFVEASKVAADNFECSIIITAKCGHCKAKSNIHPPLPVIGSATRKVVAKVEAKEEKKEVKEEKKESVPVKVKPADGLTASERKKKQKLSRRAREAAASASASSPSLSPSLPSVPKPALAPSTPTPATPEPTSSSPSHLSIKDLEVGQQYKGEVVRIKEDLGAFVQLSPVITGLLHISNITDSRVASVSKFYSVGDKIKVWVDRIDLASGKVGLTLFPLLRAYRGQGQIMLDKLKEGEVRYGIMRRVMSYGGFIDIGVLAEKETPVITGDESSRETMNEEITNVEKRGVNALLQCQEIGGAIHVWDAHDKLRNGDVVKVKVIKIDTTRAKVWVSSKALEVHTDNTGKVVQQDERDALANSPFRFLSVDMINQILRYLNPITAQHLGYSCKMFNKLANDGMSFLWEQNELVCFYSKRHFSDDTLGVGLNLENKLNGRLAYITTTFDLVSYKAFMEEKVRKAVYKEPFTHWLPLYINKKHGENAIPLATEAMAKICKDCYGSFEPWMVLEVIPKLMNSMVVSVMSGKLYASVMALEGYCAFHHLLLMFLEIYPELKQKVDDTIAIFLRDDVSRHKRVIPALGEWIPLLAVTETYSWKDVAVPYLLEMFDRNVLWTLKQYPELVEWSEKTWTDEKVASSRLRKTYDATQVSKHLIMFHVYFLDKVARPAGVSLSKIREVLDARCGKPTFAMKDQLMRECKRIRKVNEWKDFFEYIHMPAPSEQTLLEWLNSAQLNSAKVGYHRPWQFQKIIDDKRYEAMAIRDEKLKAKEEAKASRASARSDFYDDMYGR